jgi:Cu(I)/Ag(I) efflux system protein CusF
MKRILIATAMLLAAAGSYASGKTDTDRGVGVLRKVDSENQRIVIRHDDWANGNMAAMTMAMPVRNGVALSGLAKGDKVRFEVAREGQEWVVTRLEAAPQ